MEYINNLPTATLEEAFELRPAKEITEISLYESKMNTHSFDSGILQIQDVPEQLESKYIHKPFIEANTQEVNLYHLKNDCIIPVFSKDNEKTIAHQEFIEIAQDCVTKVFPHHSITQPEIRVSHQIKGRTPDAISFKRKRFT